MDEIERDALDSRVPLSDTLRKLISLGGKSGSTELRDWATYELNGYVGSAVDLPEYRRASAAITIDGGTFNAMITGQQISPRSLPDFVQDTIDEEVPLGHPIREIEEMAQRAKASNGAVSLTFPMSQDVVAVMNHESGDPFQTITRLYWSVSGVSLEGVLDRVRTNLVSLMAEMRAATPEGADVPPAAAGDQAVNVVVRGGKRHTINVASTQVSGSGSPEVHTELGQPERRSPWTTIGAFLVGAAAIVGTAVAIAAWQGWNPF